MKKKTAPVSPVSTADLLSCLVSMQPGTQTFFHEERDGHWLAVNKDLPGLKRPKPRPRPALLTDDYYSRTAVMLRIERTIRGRDRAWRDWCCDPLSQAQFENGPPPIHWHFNGE